MSGVTGYMPGGVTGYMPGVVPWVLLVWYHWVLPGVISLGTPWCDIIGTSLGYHGFYTVYTLCTYSPTPSKHFTHFNTPGTP